MITCSIFLFWIIYLLGKKTYKSYTIVWYFYNPNNCFKTQWDDDLFSILILDHIFTRPKKKPISHTQLNVLSHHPNNASHNTKLTIITSISIWNFCWSLNGLLLIHCGLPNFEGFAFFFHFSTITRCNMQSITFSCYDIWKSWLWHTDPLQV